MTHTVALVVAAGRGHRLGGDIPKQYRDMGGQSLLRASIEALRAHPAVNAVRVVIHPDDRELYDRAVRGLPLLAPVNGGPTRQESVRLGLESLTGEPPRRVLIHDAARPFVDNQLISRVLEALDEVPGAIPALPLVDTLKRQRSGTAPLVEATVERSGLWRAQTPQGFDFSSILQAHRDAVGLELTDDAAVAEQAGMAVKLVMGSEENIKLTTAEDLRRMTRHQVENYLHIVGQGFDVHKFSSGDGVVLCGVRIAHDRGLEGHSDADVGLHALTDALLGAIGAGDIGQHFPPSDPRWKNADSALFLRHAVGLLDEKSCIINNVDVTLVCESPKIAPHREAMRKRLSELLGIPLDGVSVKATTTEGLGFTGRREGIAALAMVSVRRPTASSNF